MTDIPSLASADLGKSDWEKILIRVLRSRHYQWRTEQTYRQWANRFARWMDARAPSWLRNVGQAARLTSEDGKDRRGRLSHEDGRTDGSPVPRGRKEQAGAACATKMEGQTSRLSHVPPEAWNLPPLLMCGRPQPVG